MTAHADDIAALRRLLEGVEGFAEKCGLPPNATIHGEVPEAVIALAVGVAMEMLPAGYKVWPYTRGKERGWQGEDMDRERTRSSPRLLPLLADVLCEPAGREGA